MLHTFLWKERYNSIYKQSIIDISIIDSTFNLLKVENIISDTSIILYNIPYYMELDGSYKKISNIFSECPNINKIKIKKLDGFFVDMNNKKDVEIYGIYYWISNYEYIKNTIDYLSKYKNPNILNINRIEKLQSDFDINPFSKVEILDIDFKYIDIIRNDNKKNFFYIDYFNIKSYLKFEIAKPNEISFNILSFDIEVIPNNIHKFPDSKIKNDIITSISCQLIRSNSSLEYKCVFYLGFEIRVNIDDVEYIYCNSEGDLLVKFFTFIKNHKIHLITGYNINSFDWAYIYDRLNILNINLKTIFKDNENIPKYIEKKTSTNIYGNETSKYIQFNNMINIDLYLVLKKYYGSMFKNFKLDTISKTLLNKSKIDIKYKDMFIIYKFIDIMICNKNFKTYLQTQIKLLINNISDKFKNIFIYLSETDDVQSIKDVMTSILEYILYYNIIDSTLVIEIFKKLRIDYQLIISSNLFNCNSEFYYLTGIQDKIFSLIKNTVWKTNLCIENTYYINRFTNIHIQGAIVLDPIVGTHNTIYVFDYKSLYPSVMIAYNICYSTYMNTDYDDSYYKFSDYCYYKKPYNIVDNKLISNLGILPTNLINLTNKRINIKKDMKISKLNNDEINYNILDSEQLSIKLFSNSLYGFISTNKGNLPFNIGGSSVTEGGRVLLLFLIDIINYEYYEDVEIIYGDTDSIMVKPLSLKGINLLESKEFLDLLNYKIRNFIFDKIYNDTIISEENKNIILKHLEIVELEYEKKCKNFNICKKKSYRYLNENNEIVSKGDVLNKSIYCEKIKSLYKNFLSSYLKNDDKSYQEVYMILLDLIKKFLTEKVTKHNVHNYTQRIILKNNIINYAYIDINGNYYDDDNNILINPPMNCKNIKLKSKLQHVHFAKELLKRGEDISANTQIEYVFVINNNFSNGHIERIDYVLEYFDNFVIDKNRYIIKQLIPILTVLGFYDIFTNLDEDINELLKESLLSNSHIKKYLKQNIKNENIKDSEIFEHAKYKKRLIKHLNSEIKISCDIEDSILQFNSKPIHNNKGFSIIKNILPIEIENMNILKSYLNLNNIENYFEKWNLIFKEYDNIPELIIKIIQKFTPETTFYHKFKKYMLNFYSINPNNILYIFINLSKKMNFNEIPNKYTLFNTLIDEQFKSAFSSNIDIKSRIRESDNYDEKFYEIIFDLKKKGLILMFNKYDFYSYDKEFNNNILLPFFCTIFNSIASYVNKDLRKKIYYLISHNNDRLTSLPHSNEIGDILDMSTEYTQRKNCNSLKKLKLIFED